jgi:hypothetical protein
MNARKKDPQSLPRGKDETRLVTVVREQWDKYKRQEERFSKDFALALINLHKQRAKPGSGTFVADLKTLKIPTMTAYRLMRLHGWEPVKDRPPRPKMPDTLVRDKLVTQAIGYLDQFAGAELRRQLAELIRELRNGLGDKLGRK